MTLIFNSIDLFCLWNILLELVLSKQTFNLMTLASVRIVYEKKKPRRASQEN